MNGEAGLKCINKNYRKDGKGRVNLQPFPSVAEMFLNLTKNLQLTLDDIVFMSYYVHTNTRNRFHRRGG